MGLRVLTMTYRDLLLRLQDLTDEQLDCDVTIHDQNDEYFPATLLFDVAGDVLDLDHPYLSC